MSSTFATYIPTRLEMGALFPPMSPLTAIAILLIIVPLLYVVILIRPSGPMRVLPGPRAVSWLTGSVPRGIWEPDAQVNQLEWTRQYGPVFRYHGLFMISKVITTDPQALNYILTSPEFVKSEDGRQYLERLLGKGVLVVEGLKHKKQGPAFGHPQIKVYSQLFVEKANEFRDLLMTQIARSCTPDGSLKVDIFLWLNKVTLDIIGHTGFSYAFRSLQQDEPHEISEGLRKATIFDPFDVRFMAEALIPPARLIPSDRSRAVTNALKSLRSIGQRMISQKKSEILAAIENDDKSGVEKRNIIGRDLLSILLRANMAKDIPEDARMTDEEVLAQIPTFLLAGHETTSTATVWAIYALGCHPTAYAKLAKEARGFYTDSPSMDELNGMTYLDYVAREVLRLHAPVSNTDRMATQDVVVPLNLKSLWGEDANEFKPERWEAIPESAKVIPGLFGNLLTFITGSHGCIGYRFALVEMKAILFAFVRAFDFELAVPPSEITRRTMIVARPFLSSGPQNMPQLPLVIRPARSE
ncbi:cytochrome P450 [Russula earlei]|uniref:Cytochrome P450 n=1 Tax=Russula earlei TaxID=71964 RepID=A0ACC0UQV3_9AGAM|nr:cytochrome P450 [Russula earlei]